MKNQNMAKNLIYGQIGILTATAICLVLQSEFNADVFTLIAILGIAFLVLGALIIRLGIQEKGKLRKWMIIAGVSALCPFIFSILHNVFYVLNEFFPTSINFFSILDSASFIFALIIAPIGFLIGTIIVLTLLNIKE